MLYLYGVVMTQPVESPPVYPPVVELVSGIFKGGGAKGLVYCGALHELRARGIWFTSVAGSSAGAITAALIAAGHQPDELASLAADALRQVKKKWWGSALPAGDRALYRTDRLGTWLEDLLAAAVGRPSSPTSPVTFAELGAIDGRIELHVVVMDLATQQPFVFNWSSAPGASVTQAVLASSAIPVAMRARRMIVTDADGTVPTIHRVVDGGAWANYPAFVYTDRSFRSYYGLSDTPDPRTLLGFVIEGGPYGLHGTGPVPWPPTQPVVPRRPADVRPAHPRHSRFDLGSGRRMGLLGSFLSWGALRWSLAAVVALLAVLATAGWVGAAATGFEVLDAYPTSLRAGLVIVGYVALCIALALTALFVVGQARLATEVVDTGLPALVAALSVGPSVPRWVGHHPDDRVVRLSAPLGIATTTFRPANSLRRLALVVAMEQASEQLDQYFPHRKPLGGPSRDELAGPRSTPAEDPVVYQQRLDKARQRGGNQGADTAVTMAIWGLAPLALLALIADTLSFLLVLPIGVALSTYWLRQLLNGRRRNQSMRAQQPLKQRWALRLTAGIGLLLFLVLFFPLAFPSAQDDGLTPSSTLQGVLWIVSTASVASALASLHANHARRRYLDELKTVDGSALD